MAKLKPDRVLDLLRAHAAWLDTHKKEWAANGMMFSDNFWLDGGTDRTKTQVNALKPFVGSLVGALFSRHPATLLNDDPVLNHTGILVRDPAAPPLQDPGTHQQVLGDIRPLHAPEIAAARVLADQFLQDSTVENELQRLLSLGLLYPGTPALWVYPKSTPRIVSRLGVTAVPPWHVVYDRRVQDPKQVTSIAIIRYERYADMPLDERKVMAGSDVVRVEREARAELAGFPPVPDSGVSLPDFVKDASLYHREASERDPEWIPVVYFYEKGATVKQRSVRTEVVAGDIELTASVTNEIRGRCTKWYLPLDGSNTPSRGILLAELPLECGDPTGEPILPVFLLVLEERPEMPMDALAPATGPRQLGALVNDTGLAINEAFRRDLGRVGVADGRLIDKDGIDRWREGKDMSLISMRQDSAPVGAARDAIVFPNVPPMSPTVLQFLDFLQQGLPAVSPTSEMTRGQNAPYATAKAVSLLAGYSEINAGRYAARVRRLLVDLVLYYFWWLGSQLGSEKIAVWVPSAPQQNPMMPPPPVAPPPVGASSEAPPGGPGALVGSAPGPTGAPPTPVDVSGQPQLQPPAGAPVPVDPGLLNRFWQVTINDNGGAPNAEMEAKASWQFLAQLLPALGMGVGQPGPPGSMARAMLEYTAMLFRLPTSFSPASILGTGGAPQPGMAPPMPGIPSQPGPTAGGPPIPKQGPQGPEESSSEPQGS